MGDNNLGIKMDSSNKIQLTKDGLEERKKRLDELLNVIRPRVLKELTEARAQGDLSENADYDAAKNKQAEVEEEIMNLEDLLTRAEIINNSHYTSANIGSVVSYVIIEENLNRKVKLVGRIEADPTRDIPQIGIDSPIGMALSGAKIGDIRTVKTVKKKYKIKVLNLS